MFFCVLRFLNQPTPAKAEKLRKTHRKVFYFFIFSSVSEKLRFFQLWNVVNGEAGPVIRYFHYIAYLCKSIKQKFKLNLSLASVQTLCNNEHTETYRRVIQGLHELLYKNAESLHVEREFRPKRRADSPWYIILIRRSCYCLSGNRRVQTQARSLC